MKKNLDAESRQFNRNKWIYTVPGLGRDMAYSLFSYFLLTYVLYTRQLTTKQFAALSIIMIICRIWDGVNDPIMGGIIENTRTRFGKFKPWILTGAVSNALILSVIFANRVQGWSFVVLFGVLYLFWDITFTMNDIGYWSMLPSLTSRADRRDSITSFANLFAGFGTIMAYALIPIFTAGALTIGGNSITAYAAVAVIISLLFVGGQTVVCVGVREPHVASQPLEETIGFRKMIKVILRNDQLLWVTLIMLLVNLGGAFITAFGTNYLYLEFGYEGKNVTLFAAFYAVASGIISFVYPAMAKKFSRASLAGISLVSSIAGYFLFALTGYFAPTGIKLWLYCAEALIIGFGYSLFYMVVTICLTNTIEYNEYKTGSRDEAIIFSLRPFMAKMSISLQQLIVMVVYMIIGMTSVTNRISELEQQASLNQITESAKTAGITEVLNYAPGYMASTLRLVMVVLPLVFMTAGYLTMKKKITVDEAEYQRMVSEIEKRAKETEN